MINYFLNLKEKIVATTERLHKLTVKNRREAENILAVECDYKKGNELPRITEEWYSFESGATWGGKADRHYWFYIETEAERPDEGERLYLELLTNLEDCWDKTKPQFLIYANGEIVQGSDSNHTLIPIDGSVKNEILVYAYTGTGFTKKMNLFANFVTIDKDVERLYYDIRVPLEMLDFSCENTREYVDTLKLLDNAANIVDFRYTDLLQFKTSVIAASEYIREKYYGEYCKNNPTTAKVACIGHSHIDVAWLWTMKQTREKAQRSFATALELIKEYPDYKFMSSQPFLYRAVKEDAPELYEKIKQAVADGRWEVEGGMWVESDCNLASGESLIRQIVYGKKFFNEEFGKNCEVLWLPDAFGYSAALPQILKQSGIRYFVTSKISWNDTDTMPNDAFIWRGMDGSEVFAYFLTAQEMSKDRSIKRYATYNAEGTPSQIAGTWNGFKNKELTDTALITVGHGDGGGGTTRGDIETINRLRNGIPNCPQASFSTVGDFLKRTEDAAVKSGRLQRWVGELYFEFHRGTLTTHANNKKNNRAAEFALKNAELLETACAVLGKKEYDKKGFDELWTEVLNQQFHDVLPGSAIKDVYADSDEVYEKVLTKLRNLTEKDVSILAKSFGLKRGEYLVFNPNHFTADGIVQTERGKGFVKDVPPMGFKVFSDIGFTCGIKIEGKNLENSYYKIGFDENYYIVSIYDKINEREIIKDGEKANVLTLYEDYPSEYDAWELRDYYIEKGYPLKEIVCAEAFTDGCSAGFKIIRKTPKSLFTQTIRLYENIRRIDFETKCDWHEKHSVLRTCFPIAVNAEKASFDIQFGRIERPTHANTSWDRAKFESCAHKFADISECGFGVALMNDCKYGYSVNDNELGLTLLRSPTYPDPDSDEGKHEFTYSLFSHGLDEGFRECEKEAFLLNNGLIAYRAEKDTCGKSEYSIISCDDESVNISALKRSEDENAFIVRFAETNNARHDFTVRFGFGVKEVYECDLMENEIGQVPISDNSVKIRIDAFKIKTLKLFLK